MQQIYPSSKIRSKNPRSELRGAKSDQRNPRTNLVRARLVRGFCCAGSLHSCARSLHRCAGSTPTCAGSTPVALDRYIGLKIYLSGSPLFKANHAQILRVALDRYIVAMVRYILALDRYIVALVRYIVALDPYIGALVRPDPSP